MATETILVTGASGTNGRDVIKALAGRGVPIRAAVRNRAKAQETLGSAAEAVDFDFDSPSSIRHALEGVTRVFVITPVAQNQVEMGNRVTDAAKDAGVRHIVKLSVMGADFDPPYLFGKWHLEHENYIRSSGIPFTFLRPNSFMQNFLGYNPPIAGTIYLPWGDGKASWVDTRDIAAVAAAVLTGAGHEGKIYQLTGPESLGIAEAAAILSEAAGGKITYAPIPEEAARAALQQAGLPPWQAEALLDLHAINRAGRLSQVTGDVEKVLGRPPSSFRQFAMEHADFFRKTLAS